MNRRLLATALLVLLVLPARAEEDMSVTRHDLGRALLAFERAIRDQAPEDERRAELNRGFDRATMSFFLGRGADALRAIDGLTASLAGTPRAAVKVRIRPSVIAVGEKTPPTLAWAPLHDLSGEGRITLNFRDAEGKLLQAVEVPAEPGEVPLPPSVLDLPTGDYDVEASRAGTSPAIVARFSVLPRPAAELARQAVTRLEAMELPPSFATTIACATARARLLGEAPSEARGVHLVEAPARLAREVGAEVEAIGGGEDPYRRRGGEIWRVLDADGAEVPFRLYAPTAATGDDPVPAVIALHGAGGDENLFLSGYGAGRIRDLADRHGFLVVCPLTTAFSTRPEVFDTLMAVLGREYAIDPARVTVVGHSLGAGAAAILARARPEALAAVALIAGGGFATDLPVPTLVVAGGLDPIARGRAGPGVRVHPNEGHTLLVSRCLPEVVDFLLRHRREKD